MACRPSWMLLCFQDDRGEEWDTGLRASLGIHVLRLGPVLEGGQEREGDRGEGVEVR